MAPGKTDKSVQQEQLKNIIRKLHDGARVEDLKKEFSGIVQNTTPEEIAEMENALIREGFPPEEIQRLCDVHVQVFEDSLRKVKGAGKIPGHPVYTMTEENREARRISRRLLKAARKVRKSGGNVKDQNRFTRLLHRLREIEKHYQRKENQLFPMLENRGFTGPTKVMWGKHDEIRDRFRRLMELTDREAWGELPAASRSLAGAIKKMIFLEEKILFPTALRKLREQEWARIREGEGEIGFAWITPGSLWEAGLRGRASRQNQFAAKEEQMTQDKMDKIKLSRGELTAKQVNLLLKNLPVDITFVDENDRVCYYSDTRERIFVRSPGIIGREVQNCHPPKSVHIVNEIVESFKKKEKKSAEFWIQMDGKFIHIRYFPLYDEQGHYRGVIEVSQEVSGIRELKGEKRLLDR